MRPNFMCIWDFYTTRMLHSISSFFMFTMQICMHFSDCGISAFHELLKFEYKENVACIDFSFFLWARNASIYVLVFAALPNFMYFWDSSATTLLHPAFSFSCGVCVCRGGVGWGLWSRIPQTCYLGTLTLSNVTYI